MGSLPLLRGLALLLLGLVPAALTAETRIDGANLSLRLISSGLDMPLALAAPPGDPRLFVVEKTGKIRIIRDGALLTEPFLDLSVQVSTNSERGLLGLAFSPDFTADGRVFLYFTDPEGTIQIAAVTATGDRANPASLTPVLSVPHPDKSNHNGGWLGFGPDGYLYIATGDGGGGGDPSGNAQDPDRLLGKMLRLDVSVLPYQIPPDNPFAKGSGAPEVFFTGLRNPWRNAFDGPWLYIADVGQQRLEEVNVTRLTPGLNFGWNRMEGQSCYGSDACDTSGLTPPALVYDHDRGCSITGGLVYRGAAIPALQGRYLYADYCTGEVMSFRWDGSTARDPVSAAGLHDLTGLTSFGQDGAGEMYLIFGAEGRVEKLVSP